MSVGQIIEEPLQIHGIGGREERKEKVLGLLSRMGLDSADMKRRPHEFSGGQRQRIAIARALVLEPAFLVADEPVSSLDYSSRAQIMSLMESLRNEMELTTLLISHELQFVTGFCDRVAVMWRGRFVEMAKTRDLIEGPLHPYTRALLRAVNTDEAETGSPESLQRAPEGELQEVSPDHWVAK
jgi:peptide/nickel transport system ATP-binding protein